MWDWVCAPDAAKLARPCTSSGDSDFNVWEVVAVWLEVDHYHAVVKTESAHRWKGLKMYMQSKGVYLNVKTMPYDAAFRYCTIPSPKKPRGENEMMREREHGLLSTFNFAKTTLQRP